MKKLVRRFTIAIILILGIIQVSPYAFAHSVNLCASQEVPIILYISNIIIIVLLVVLAIALAIAYYYNKKHK